MTDPPADTAPVPRGDLVAVAASTPAHAGDPRLSAAGQAALDAAQALGRKAAAPATLRATKADWSHYTAWCAAHGFVPVPAEPVTVGAYLASLAQTHAPATVRRRLAAIGKMHRFNDLPWNAGRRDIAGPLGGLLRERGRPARKAAALTLAMLRRLVATCDGSNRGRRDRALLLIGFAAALRRSELVALRVEDVALPARRPAEREPGRDDRPVTAVVRTPWEVDPALAVAPTPLPPVVADPKPRGRRPAPSRQGAAPAGPAWLYHHLTVTGPAAATGDFAAAARGPGVTPWRLDGAALEEDVFNLAVAQPPERRALDVAGCRILARQFRDRVEARQARAVALVGRDRTGAAASQVCPFDLHTLLPVPDAILRQGPTHPAALAWLAAHWGVGDGLRHVAERPNPRPGRRLPLDHAVIGYGFFTGGDTPDAAIAALAPRWPALRLALQPRPD